jgi:hypothetical protein
MVRVHLCPPLTKGLPKERKQMSCLQEQISVDEKGHLLISVLGKGQKKVQLENRIMKANASENYE